MAKDYNGHQLSVGDRKGNEKPPLSQHKRLAMGEKVDGKSNPNGAAKGPTDNRIANNQGKRY